MAKSAKLILDQREQGVAARSNFESYWQTLHDFYDNAGMDVNTSYYPGTELTVNQIYDTYSFEAADVLASGLNNYLTPSASRWFGLRTRDPLKMEKKQVLHYLKDVEAEVFHALNTSNFYDVVPQFFRKSGVYGTSVLFEEEDPFDMVRFYSMPMKNVVIVDDARGRAVEYYIDFEYTPTQAVTRFGPDKVHPEILKLHTDDRHPDKKFIFTLYIGPNWERNPQALNTENKPWIAQWIDKKHRTEIKRGGYDELPALAHRFYKRDTMAWGFSPAMKALIDVRVLNTKARTQLRSEMKHTDPAIAMPDDAFLAPFNGNPRGVNYYQKGKLNQGDIWEIGNYGNPMVGRESIEYSKERIRSQMFVDVFQAFEGITKQMNNPEVFERISEKMSLLGPAVGRFIAVFDDVIDRTINLLGRQGRLPEPPQEILEDPNYEVDYLSTLAKAQRNPELQSLQNALLMTGELANFSPDVVDKVNPDKGVDVIWGITGAPVQMLRDDEEVKNIRDGRMEQQAAEQQAAMVGAGAEVALKATQASKNVREAQAIGM